VLVLTTTTATGQPLLFSNAFGLHYVPLSNSDSTLFFIVLYVAYKSLRICHYLFWSFYYKSRVARQLLDTRCFLTCCSSVKCPLRHFVCTVIPYRSAHACLVLRGPNSLFRFICRKCVPIRVRMLIRRNDDQVKLDTWRCVSLFKSFFFPMNFFLCVLNTGWSKSLCVPGDYILHTSDELKMAITVYIRNADRAVLNTVFENTVRPVNKCLEIGGRHFEHYL